MSVYWYFALLWTHTLGKNTQILRLLWINQSSYCQSVESKSAISRWILWLFCQSFDQCPIFSWLKFIVFKRCKKWQFFLFCKFGMKPLFHIISSQIVTIICSNLLAVSLTGFVCLCLFQIGRRCRFRIS